jgi:hypothetical protein
MKGTTMLQWIYKTVVGCLLGVIAFFLVGMCNRLARVEVELVQVRIDIANMRILSSADVREIAQAEILRYESRRAAERVGVEYPPVGGR